LSVEHATAGLSDHAVRVDTPGQSVVFELADGWRRVSKEAHIPLTVKWQEHSIEFEIKTTWVKSFDRSRWRPSTQLQNAGYTRHVIFIPMRFAALSLRRSHPHVRVERGSQEMEQARNRA